MGSESKTVWEASQAAKIQKNQCENVENQMEQVHSAMMRLGSINSRNEEDLDDLLAQADALYAKLGMIMDAIELSDEDIQAGKKLADLDEVTDNPQPLPKIDFTDTVELSEGMSWEDYQHSLQIYTNKNQIDMETDPYANLMTKQQHDNLMQRIQSDSKLKG